MIMLIALLKFDMINKHTGAIAPLANENDYDFEILDTHIQDFAHNATRFLIIKTMLISIVIRIRQCS